MAEDVLDRHAGYSVLPRWVLETVGLFSPQVRELRELLPRYAHDNRFDSAKFNERFPGFAVTRYREGLEFIRAEADRRA